MAFGTQHALAYKSACDEHAIAAVPGHELVPCGSDSEIGSDEEECFRDFKDGFHAFQKKAPVKKPAAADTEKAPARKRRKKGNFKKADK